MAEHDLFGFKKTKKPGGFWVETLDPQNNALWFHDNGNRLKRLHKLISSITAPPASSADAERGFSQQNQVKASQRSRLTFVALDAIMRVRMNGNEDKLAFDKLARLWVQNDSWVGSRKTRGTKTA